MLIPVVFHDGRQDEVEPFVLDRLLEDQQLTSFLRSSGWVMIGRDSIRRSRRKVYCIPERRQHEMAARL